MTPTISQELIAKVDNYQPSHERLQAFQDTSMVFMVGISGAGKDTITNRLLTEYADSYSLFVTHTTRPPRENHGVMEQNGREYYFIDLPTAERMLDAQDYVEANVYGSNIYGTSMAEIKRAHDEHKILISDIDVNGVAHMIELLPDSKPIFILPPSFDVWQQRFMTRYSGEVDQDDWRQRMHTAYMEIVHALAHDYFYLVVNDDLQKTVEEINLITHGQHPDHRPAHASEVAESILAELRKII